MGAYRSLWRRGEVEVEMGKRYDGAGQRRFCHVRRTAISLHVSVLLVVCSLGSLWVRDGFGANCDFC